MTIADEQDPPVGRVLVAVALALAPVVALSLSPWSALTGVVVLGILPTLSATPAGLRSMRAALLASTAVAFVTVLVASTDLLLPALGTALVVLLGFATGTVSPRGLHPTGAATIAFAAYLLVDPAHLLATVGEHRSALPTALALAGIVLAGCAWVIGVVWLLLRTVTLPLVAGEPTLPYGALLGVLCGAFTLVCLLWFRGTNAWWTVLTVAMILQPTRDDTRTRLNGRIAGTVVGGTATALLVALLPGTGATSLIGTAAALLSVLLLLAGAPYWAAAAATTVSVVLLTFDPDAMIAGDLQRILVTILAGGVTALVVRLGGSVARVETAEG